MEKTPKSRLDDEPGLNENLSPAPLRGSGGGTIPPPPPKPVNPARLRRRARPARATGSATPAAWDTDSQDASADQPRRPPPGVRRASLNERLQPFIDESTANELMYPNKADRPWRYIVLHHSASASGNYDQIDAEHRKILGIDGCGYHFVIGNGTGSRDGQIEVSQRWNNQKQGAHTRNARTHDADEYGIGICLVGDFDQQPPSVTADRRDAGLDRLPQQALQHRAPAACGPTPTSPPPRRSVLASIFPSEAMLMVTKDA